MSVFRRLFFQNQIFFNESKFLGKTLSYLGKQVIGINYYSNYGSSKLLLHVIEHLLGQLNSKRTKIAVKVTIQFPLTK